MKRNEGNMKIEMKVGLLFIAAFGVLNVLTNTHEFAKGFIFTIGITLIFLGGMNEYMYKRLKMIKKAIIKK